jgi:nucleotide-binding universal stress UspA family protein
MKSSLTTVTFNRLPRYLARGFGNVRSNTRSDRRERTGDNAVKTGLDLAAELGATVHVLYVVEEFEGRIEPITGEQEDESERYHEQGEEIASEVAKAAKEIGVDCVTAVADGVVHDEIQHYIEENGIGFVVMGSRGRTTVEKAILGSTADKIIRTVDKPVTIVHEEPQSFVGTDRDIHPDSW